LVKGLEQPEAALETVLHDLFSSILAHRLHISISRRVVLWHIRLEMEGLVGGAWPVRVGACACAL
ncbi:MAG TPA: hypothetical protein QF802_01930, partial [Candidatus Thalassarchaeaceae archaeon]|nr:hypothetical protein [Candidatus Thalassarchaeaceae archaeon]